MRKREPVDELKMAKGVPVPDSSMQELIEDIKDCKKNRRGREGSESRGQDSRVADCWVEVK